jgi:hypothetical protein
MENTMIDYEKCPMFQEMEPDWKEGIKKEGCIYPYYGVAPHKHIPVDFKGHKGVGTKTLDKSEWPKNFIEDSDCEGCGIYKCPHEEICKKN